MRLHPITARSAAVPVKPRLLWMGTAKACTRGVLDGYPEALNPLYRWMT